MAIWQISLSCPFGPSTWSLLQGALPALHATELGAAIKKHNRQDHFFSISYEILTDINCSVAGPVKGVKDMSRIIVKVQDIIVLSPTGKGELFFSVI